MPSQIVTLPIDCLSKIFECLDEDKVTLHSCLLVNRLWCRISVEILWRNIWDFKCTIQPHRSDVLSKIFNTLIACLPDESKDLLFKNGIFISTPTSKLPLFNYPSFCKVLSIIDLIIITGGGSFILEEILKMYMKQISSLKRLIYNLDIYYTKIPNFINFPGAKDCLKNLSELRCSSNINSEFFYQLSQICHNIQLLTIEISTNSLDRLNDLISSQNNLKSISFIGCICEYENVDNTKLSLTKNSNTLTKLYLQKISPLSFLTELTNLQELTLTLVEKKVEDFEVIQHVTFPHLQILKFIDDVYPKIETLIKFLENSGKNLRKFQVGKCNKSLSLAIGEFCPNLESLHTILMFDIKSLAVIFRGCQQLESLKTLCSKTYLKGKKLLEIVAKYSPENFHELKLHNYVELDPNDLETFFMSWKKRVPQKPLSLIVSSDSSFILGKKTKKIIMKYKSLGIVEKFEDKFDPKFDILCN